MTPYKMNCPKCDAELLFQFDQTQTRCIYCGSIISRSLTDEQKQMIQTEKERFEIKTILDKRMQLDVLTHKKNSIDRQIGKVSSQSFQMPVPRMAPKGYNFWIAGLTVPFFLGFITICCLLWASILAGFIWLAITGASVPLFNICLKKIKNEKIQKESEKAEAEMNKQLFNADRERKIEELQRDCAGLEEEIRKLAGLTNVSFLPRQYQSDDALNYIYDVLSRDNSLTLQQALYQYDIKTKQDNFERQQREQEQQKAQLRAQQVQMQLQLQQEQIKLRQEQIKMEQLQIEQQQQMARMPFQSPSQVQIQSNVQMPFQTPTQVVQQVTVVNRSTPTVFSSGEISTMNSSPPPKCPNCGSRFEWKKRDETRSGVNVGAAVVGGLFLGPLGLLAGAVGHSVEEYHCTSCGFTRRYKH